MKYLVLVTKDLTNQVEGRALKTKDVEVAKARLKDARLKNKKIFDIRH